MAPVPMLALRDPSPAPREVELSDFDLRFESHRLKQAAVEERLLVSLAERGIEEPLEGVDVGEKPILLNGFKRSRCARKLGMFLVPYRSLGLDEASGILAFLRTSKDRRLALLEEAMFLEELNNTHNLSLQQLAEGLLRSKAWVSVRLGMIGGMSAVVRQKLFAGDFPAYSFIYTLRPFRRLNGGGAKEVEEFVVAVSGQDLSVRDIELLAQGYFRGNAALRSEIRQGKVALPLARMKEERAMNADGCSEFESGLLRDLEVMQKLMLRVMGKSEDPRLEGASFHAQSQLLAAATLTRAPAFLQSVRRLHDRGGPA
jgi:hypothetical protein